MRTIPVFILILTLVSGLWLSGCKTTEANYRSAYELAKKKDGETALDSTIYSKIRREARPQTVVVGTDTIAMKAEYVAITKDGGGNRESFHPYNVVIAGFKQLFNAKSVRKRAIEAGFENAFIIQTREPLYYVVAVSCLTPADANKALIEVAEKNPVVMKDPYPFILRRR